MFYSAKFWGALRGVINVMLVVYMLAPLVIIFVISFSSALYLTFPPPGLSLQWYEKMFSNPTWTRTLVTSLKIMVPAAIVATVLGTAAALALSRMESKWALVIRAVLMAPLVVPVIITAAAIFGVFRIWGLYGSLSGLILAHVILTLPYVLSTVSANLAVFDKRLEDAAANCGAPPWTAFRRVTLPLISPSVMSGMLFAMVISFDELVVSLFLSTPRVRPVTVQMWSNIKGDTDPTIAAIATVLFLFSLLALLADGLARRRSGREPGL
ncbi:ABC transporter permease [Phaeobacter sp.]|uniref:ABC transporter permease n=1 Tax=Phaeobacter sp. TaxID=1902409 RepID=UPI0025E3A4A7|nr:ABC transporter permease [Phaeobacter sp.]